MKYMVCNCNSFGNVDYKIPLFFKDTDYRTTYYRTFKYYPSEVTEYYGINSIKTPENADLLTPLRERFTTEVNKQFPPKNAKSYQSERPNLSMTASRTQYMINMKEKMFQNPPAPKQFGVTEHKAEYNWKQPVSTEKLPICSDNAICPINSTGRGEQPRVKVEETGIYKMLDPYVTTSAMAHVPFTRNQLEKVKEHPLTFYNSKDDATLNMKSIRKPINDELKFQLPIQSRIVPKQVCRVPFTGKTSEYMGNYVPPTKGCLYNYTFSSCVEFTESLPKPSMFQTLAAPHMYCTEQCHIGSGWPVRVAVGTKRNDDFRKVYKHEPCKHHIDVC